MSMALDYAAIAADVVVSLATKPTGAAVLDAWRERLGGASPREAVRLR
jgi:hypothetical protein